MPLSLHRRIMLPRVMPGMQYCPDEVQTSPRLTMKKWVELQVATKPRGSSIKASSAPAFMAWTQAVMQLSFECELSFWSCTSGAPRRTFTVCRRHAAFEFFRAWGFVFGDDDDGRRRDRHARILIGRCLDAARHHQADVHAVAASYWHRCRRTGASPVPAGVMPTSMKMALAPS